MLLAVHTRRLRIGGRKKCIACGNYAQLHLKSCILCSSDLAIVYTIVNYTAKIQYPTAIHSCIYVSAFFCFGLYSIPNTPYLRREKKTKNKIIGAIDSIEWKIVKIQPTKPFFGIVI